MMIFDAGTGKISLDLNQNWSLRENYRAEIDQERTRCAQR
jgi:hypothetical protein